MMKISNNQKRNRSKRNRRKYYEKVLNQKTLRVRIHQKNCQVQNRLLSLVHKIRKMFNQAKSNQEEDQIHIVRTQIDNYNKMYIS